MTCFRHLWWCTSPVPPPRHPPHSAHHCPRRLHAAPGQPPDLYLGQNVNLSSRKLHKVLTQKSVTYIFWNLISRLWFWEVTEFLVEHSLELRIEITFERKLNQKRSKQNKIWWLDGSDLVLFDKSDHTVNFPRVDVTKRYDGTFSTLTLTVSRLVWTEVTGARPTLPDIVLDRKNFPVFLTVSLPPRTFPEYIPPISEAEAEAWFENFPVSNTERYEGTCATPPSGGGRRGRSGGRGRRPTKGRAGRRLAGYLESRVTVSVWSSGAGSHHQHVVHSQLVKSKWPSYDDPGNKFCKHKTENVTLCYLTLFYDPGGKVKFSG